MTLISVGKLNGTQQPPLGFERHQPVQGALSFNRKTHVTLAQENKEDIVVSGLLIHPPQHTKLKIFFFFFAVLPEKVSRPCSYCPATRASV